MDNYPKTYGKTTIAPEVLISICQLSALSVEGVSQLAPIPKAVSDLFRKSGLDGVKVEVVDSIVYIDLYVVIKRDVNVREVSHMIQTQVARSITEMLGMEIGKINIHIEDIDFKE